MKSRIGLMSVFAALAMGGTETPNWVIDEPTETDEEKKQRLAESEIKLNKAHGLKEFYYGENRVLAINQKNADRKARIKNLI